MTDQARRHGRGATVLGVTSVVFIVAMTLVPVLVVGLRSFTTTPSLDALGGAAWSRIMGSGRTWRILGVTIAQALVSSGVSVVIGTPVAYALARYRFPGRYAARTLATVPFVLPSVVLGSAFAAIFSARGLFEARGSWWLVVLAHVCFNLAVVIRTVGGALAGVDPSVESAAAMLGRSRPRVFLDVVLPQVRGSIAAAAAIVFLFCLTSFGVIVILGGGSVTTMEVEIWTRATRQFDLSGAAVLGIVQLLAVVVTLAAETLIRRRHRFVGAGAVHDSFRPQTTGERSFVVAAVLTLVTICGVPLAALGARSLSVPGGYGFDNWRHLGSVLEGTGLRVSPFGAILNSLVYASVALAIAVPLAVVAARFTAAAHNRVFDAIVLLPLGLSATMIGLGMVILSPSLPFDLRRSFWIIPLAQTLVAVPLMTRVLIPTFRSVDPDVLDAAAVLGANARQRFWRVEVAQALPGMVAAAGLGFVICIGEFGATVFVARNDRMTVPVLVERLMARPGGAGYGQAMAMCVVLTLTCAVVLGVVDRLSVNRGRELMPI